MNIIKEPQKLNDQVFACSCSGVFGASNKEYKQRRITRERWITKRWTGNGTYEEIPMWEISTKCVFCGLPLSKVIPAEEPSIIKEGCWDW